MNKMRINKTSSLILWCPRKMCDVGEGLWEAGKGVVSGKLDSSLESWRGRVGRRGRE